MTELPIDPLISDIVAKVQRHLNVILTATPGAGKTTRLPPALLQAVGGKVLVLQPRRMAAVAACTRVCSERNWTLGGAEAGYQVRHESKVRTDTRLVYMTDALLLRRMIDDPELNGVDLVVMDEFHERNLNQDLILGALRELQEMGRPIKLLIMSATLDLARLQRFLTTAVTIDVPGQIFPLDLRHSNLAISLKTDRDFIDRVVDSATQATRETRGDILVFLPGVGEIARVEERLREKTQRQVVPLHGSLPLAAQQNVLLPPTSPRVILSTNVAEASVTVQGVDYVIDSGLARWTEMNPRTGFSSLELQRIALFNARQRAGRAARQKEGVCVRLWTPHEEVTQAVEPVPESQRADLSSALLWLAHLGVTEFSTFSWFDPPPGPLLGWALKALYSLGALDRQNRMTDLGRKILRYPVPPRQGALLAFGESRGVGTTAAHLAAILGERDFADQIETHANTECDMLLRLDLLREGRMRNVIAILESARQLERLVQPGRASETQVRELLLKTQVDRLCRRRGHTDRAVMVGGRGVRLSPRSQVRESEFFVALQGVDLPGQPDTSIALASGFSKDFVLSHLSDRVQVTEDLYFDENKNQFFMRRVRRLEDLPLDEPTLTPVSPEQVGTGLVDFLKRKWTWVIEKNPSLRIWNERLRFLQQHDPKWQVEESVIHQVLDMAAFGRTKVDEVLSQDLVGYLESALPAEFVRVMRAEVPERFQAPSGVAHPILYSEMHTAYVDVRLQEIFGLLKTPRLAFGKVALTFRLLAPNYRPMQVTSDLENFWRSGYHEVRRELRTRYPKHSWPEDPYGAKPEAKGRKRPGS